MKMNAQGVVRLFGGPSTLLRRLNDMGHDISLKAVDMWVYRGSIPGKWLVELAALAKKDRIKFDLTQFMIDDRPAPTEEEMAKDEDNDLDFLN